MLYVMPRPLLYSSLVASPLPTFIKMQTAHFSLKMRKVKAKRLAKRRVKKYKLKTKKAAQKRFHVVGTL